MNKATKVLSAIVLATSALASTQAFAETTLRMGLLVSNRSLAYRAAERFAEHVNEATSGEYVVELFPSQQLGSGKEMMNMLKLGALDFYQGTNTQPTFFEEGRNFSATSAPYVFQNQDEFLQFLDSPLFAEMTEQFAEGGVETVGYMGSRSPRAITTANTPVRTPADMDGLKMRVPGSPPFVAFFEKLGTIPTPMPFSEFFTSVKTGLVEGQDNGIEVVYPRGLYEVQSYYTVTDHAMGSWMLFAGRQKMQGWPEELQTAVTEGLEIAAAYSDEELNMSIEEAFAGIQENGMEIIQVDKSEWIAVAQEVWVEMDGTEWDEGFMDRVQAQLSEFR